MTSKGRSSWPALLALAIVAVGPAGARERYVWHFAGLRSLQFGVDGTDDRALRIDCNDDGSLSIGGPAFEDGAEGDPVTMRVSSTLGSEVLHGDQTEAGDGMNFDLPVTARGVALQTLLAGRPLRISQGRNYFTVPGAGAPAKLRRLIGACHPAPPGKS
ncbi:MAG: hypothetical protein ACHP7N_07350 [Caulobacterales bacterium]